MAFTTPNMGLKIWNLITDLFSHSDLASNLATVDTHDHSNGKGVQIQSAGIAPLAITAGKIASGSITSAQIAANAGILLTQTTGFPFVLTSTNITAAPGSVTVATSGVTITLPSPITAPPLPITISSGATVTSASPVTVAGSSIYGPGLIAATSFVLGQPVASVTLFPENGSWVMIAGQQDTGVLLCTSNQSGWVAPNIRLIGDQVLFGNEFRGGGTSSALTANGTVTCFTLPAVITSLMGVNGVEIGCVARSSFAASSAGFSIGFAGSTGLALLQDAPGGTLAAGSSCILEGVSFRIR